MTDTNPQNITDEETIVSDDNYMRLEIDAFVRAFSVNRDRPVAFLLGAGASVSSGLPSAERCIWEWKREIFVSKNPTLRDVVGELSLEGTKSRIQRWLDQQSCYPKKEDPAEYSFYAAECYPSSEDRRVFFQRQLAEASPHTGYRLLPLLARADLVRSVWTTNFDGLANRAAAAENVVCIEVGMDTNHRAERPQSRGELRVVALHGDYRYDSLKNTAAELQAQDENLRSELQHDLRDHDLVVSGYSGRDQSLMSALHETFSKSCPTRLYWCGFGPEIPPEVRNLLSKARRAGNKSFYVETQGFDDLITRISLRALDGDDYEIARSIVDENHGGNAGAPKAFEISDRNPSALIKSNAYPFTHPMSALRFPVKFPREGSWSGWLHEKLLPKRVASVVFEKDALAIGTSKLISSALNKKLQKKPNAFAISEADVAQDGRICFLFRQALVISLAEHLNVHSDDQRRLWERSPYQNQSHKGRRYSIHRAVSLRLDRINDRNCVVLTPEIVPLESDGSSPAYEVGKAIRNALYGFQHNDKFDGDLKHWISKIAGSDIPVLGGATFRIDSAPLYAGIVDTSKRQLGADLIKHASQRGIVVKDADLVFSSTSGQTEATHPSPLQGLVKNRPWDHQITSSGLMPQLEVNVICPSRDSDRISRFLKGLHDTSQPSDSEKDYLQDFPGFSAAFGLPMKVSSRESNGWIDLDDSVSGNPLGKGKMLAERICRCLDQIRSYNLGGVTVVYVPTRWSTFEKVDSDNESFDLHHFVKAYAARHGMSTQFIRERTVDTDQECRVRWWVSLASFVKALRTPWRLDCLDEETAFVGVGYSIDKGANRENQILLGCSHLYNARGEGLQFRLGKIEDPIIRRRNAFMSLDDARRTGERIRQLFYESQMRLPRRVVIHKRTEFLDDEKQGLFQGLEGVENVELIEISVTPSLRYLSSKQTGSNLQIDRFPVSRGTTVIMDQQQALLWVHGVTPSAKNPNYKYYQGKRRIPAPLQIRRYAGDSDFTQIAGEILGLSKMNWNTFDYYSRMPATLDSASAIARLGPYLGGFTSAPYDYRLLI